MTLRVLPAVLSAAALSACTLAPAYQRPDLPIATTWPTAEAEARFGSSGGDLPWREVFQDRRLRSLVELALSQNRDLRVAVSDIERARAQYRVQRADLLPAINASLSQTQSRTPASVSQTGGALEILEYRATVGFAAYELDLFGRVRSLSAAALQQYFATEENRRTVQISLVAEIAGTYLALAADQDLLRVAQDTLKSRDDALALSRKRFEAGAASELDVRQAETLSEQARSDAAEAAARVGQDRAALELLLGAPAPAELLPNGDLAAIDILGDLPPGLPSDVLARRPDVLAAEHNLQAQNANIGAARAAFFPRISLTGSAGGADPSLDNLFTGAARTWSFAPQITLPIFSGGANIANLGVARANRDIAVAQYEKAVQTAFRDVADALAVGATIRERVAAQQRLATAAAAAERLTQARYDRGVDSYLGLLDAKRTLYSAQRTLIAAQLDQAVNRVELYKALGGGLTP